MNDQPNVNNHIMSIKAGIHSEYTLYADDEKHPCLVVPKFTVIPNFRFVFIANKVVTQKRKLGVSLVCHGCNVF